jgi:hypothetical protein
VAHDNRSRAGHGTRLQSAHHNAEKRKRFSSKSPPPPSPSSHLSEAAMDLSLLRTLPRLALDAVQCLLAAHDYVDQDLRSETQDAITCLRSADMTDVVAAASVLRAVTPHLLDVETRLDLANRSHTARKIRDVRRRVLAATAAVARS